MRPADEWRNGSAVPAEGRYGGPPQERGRHGGLFARKFLAAGRYGTFPPALRLE